MLPGNSLAGQWLGLGALPANVTCSITGGGTKILQAVWCCLDSREWWRGLQQTREDLLSLKGGGGSLLSPNRLWSPVTTMILHPMGPSTPHPSDLLDSSGPANDCSLNDSSLVSMMPQFLISFYFSGHFLLTSYRCLYWLDCSFSVQPLHGNVKPLSL